MIVKKLTDIPSAKVEMEGVNGASRQLALGTPDGAPNFSMRVFTLEPGGHTPYHEHAFEHVTYAITGQGDVSVHLCCTVGLRIGADKLGCLPA